MFTKAFHLFIQNKLFIFLFVAAWLNLPGLIYERFSLDKLLAYHGHNLVPFFLPILYFGILIYLFIASRFYKYESFKISAQHIIIFLAVLGIFSLELLNSALYGFRISLRIIQPIIFLIFFYTLFKGFSLFNSTINKKLLAKYSFYIVGLILFIHMLGFMGLVPHFLSVADTDGRIANLTGSSRLNVVQMNISSYYAVFMLVLIFFCSDQMEIKRRYLFFFFILSIALIFLNQSRGAILLGLAFIFLKIFYFKSNIFIKFLLLIFSLIGLLGLITVFGGSRITDLGDSSGLERILMILYTWNQIQDYPWLGQGAAFENSFRLPGIVPLLIHSFILRYTVAYGIIGTLLFFVIYYVMHKKPTIKALVITYGFLFGIGIFETYVQWWLSILPILFSNEKEKRNT